MGYVYQDTVRGAPRNILTVPASSEDVLREQFAQTFEENPIMAVKRWNELREDYKTGPTLPAEEARQKLKDAGLENDLKVSDAGITQAALDTLMFRKRIEKKRQEIFARSEGGLVQGAARLGLAFATTLSDPISAGLNFVPVVGQVRYARWLSKAGSLAGRIGVRAGVGAAEGVAGAALYEPFLYTMRTQEQADYDAADSLLNVAFGGLVGSGLHVTVGSLGELYSRLRPAREPAPKIEPVVSEPSIASAVEAPRAADIVNAMTPEAQHATLRAAVGQAVEGRRIDVSPIVQSAPIRQTELPEFKRWFGDSKVVGEDGKPLIVYHGTTEMFDVFNTGERVETSTKNNRIAGAYFSANANDAADYAARSGGEQAIVPAYISMSNPKEVTLRDGDSYGDIVGRFSAKRMADLEREGYDGLVVHYDTSGPYGLKRRFAEVVAFRPEQIKSAIGNSGRFDPKNASLTDAIDPEYRAATEHAEATLARDVDDTAELNLKSAEEEADLAEAEAKELAKRLGVDITEDLDMAAVAEAAEKAERWARAAELATVCLVRGG